MSSFDYHCRKSSVETLNTLNDSIPKRAMSISYAKKNNTYPKSNRSSNSSGHTQFDSDLQNDSSLINNLEVEGENLFNSIYKPVGENLNKRFSTAEAQRLSIISMNQLNLNDDKISTSAPPANGTSPIQESLDSPASVGSATSPLLFKDLELTPDPNYVRRQMSLKSRSVFNSDSSRSPSKTLSDSDNFFSLNRGNAFVHSIDPSSANSPSQNTSVSRKSSLLASADVLSSNTTKPEKKPSRTSLVVSNTNEPPSPDATPFKGNSFYKFRSAGHHSQSDVEMDPLDTTNINQKSPQYKRKFPRMHLINHSRNTSDDMDHIIKSISENTRDQLRRSTHISLSSQSSGRPSNLSTKSVNSNDTPDLVGFSFVKGTDKQKQINLNEAGYSDEEFSNTYELNKKHKKSGYNWLDMF